MKHKEFRGGLRALLFCLLCVVIFPSAAEAATRKKTSSAKVNIESTFANPDFAFPQTVRKDAYPEYDKAMKTGNALTALRAAMQLNVADRITSTDSLASSLARYQAIAERFSVPYSSIAKLLQADLLAAVYGANSWKFNQRELPDSVPNSEPMLWSGKQFRLEVERLCREVLAESDALSATPISTIRPILTNTDQAEKFGFSVLDFVTYDILSLGNNVGMPESDSSATGVLPFTQQGNTSSVKDTASDWSRRKLIDSLIAYDEKRVEKSPADIAAGAGALCEARLRRLSYFGRNDDESFSYEYPFGKSVQALLDLYPIENPLRSYVVCRLCESGWMNSGNLSSKKALLALLEETISATDDKNQIALMQATIADLKNITYSLQTPSVWIPGEKQRLAISGNNIKDTYLLMVPVSASFAESSRSVNKNITASGKIRQLARFRNAGDVLSQMSDTLLISESQPGYYAIVLSASPDLAGQYETLKNRNADIVNVSGISMFTTDYADSKIHNVNDNGRLDKNIFVTDAHSNAPIKGAKVTFMDNSNRSSVSTVLTTDADGKVKTPYQNFRAIAEYAGSRMVWQGGKGYMRNFNDSRCRANVLTDLALYHPGDTVSAVVVVYDYNGNLLSAVTDGLYDVTLYDANGKKASKDSVSLDKYGRGVVSLPIPSEGLTGQFRINVTLKDSKSSLGQTCVEVAEYQEPTFRMTLDDVVVPDNSDNDTVKIQLGGSVMTWSGMPLQDAEVKLTLSYTRPWRFYGNMSNADDYGLSLTTDAAGRFSAILEMSATDAEKYRYGSFTVKGTATSAAGETQQASAVRFTLGKGYSLSVQMPDKIEATGDELDFDVKVVDNLSNPVKKNVKYIISELAYDSEKESGKTISGLFDSPVLKIPSGKLPSGMYKFTFILPDAYNNEKGEWIGDTVMRVATIWRRGDVRPPHADVLWTEQNEYYASPDGKRVEVVVGAGFADESVYYEIDNKYGVERSGWLRPNGKNVKISVTSPENGDVRSVRLYGMYDGKSKETTINILPARMNQRGELRVMTFRDKITPGNQEIWKFRFMIGQGNDPTSIHPAKDAAVMAVLSNEALNAITPFEWRFNPSSMLSSYTFGNISGIYAGSVYSSGRLNDLRRISFNNVGIDIPQFDFWGYSIASGRDPVNIRGAKYRTLSKNMATTGAAEGGDMVYAESVVNEVYMSAASAKVEAVAAADEATIEVPAEVNGSDGSGKSESLRDVSMPVAFFKPLLTTDENGEVEVEFKVPDFNTTWVLQLMGYDKDMTTASLTQRTVASKPIMAQTFMPLFLRTGDKAQISATIFNNSTETADIKGMVEVFDVMSGKSISRVSEDLRSVVAGESRVLTVTVDVPADVNMLGVRAIGESSLGSDGEQSLVQVLPSSTPVMDATTFYLTGNEKIAEVKLPKLHDTDCVTLNFCNNPQWLALTELSGVIQPSSSSTLDAAVALYSNSVASGLIHRYPVLKSALEKAFSEEAGGELLSPLMKNASLKDQQLYSTPWVNNAESETLRMLSLESLLDKSQAETAISKSVVTLLANVNSDGSWSWVKGMPGSEWITAQVLSSLGDMKQTGYMPSDSRLDKAISNAVSYVDTEVAKAYTAAKKHGGKYSLSSEIGWMYIRGNVSESRPAGKQADIMNDMYRRLPAEWKDLSLYDKTTAAILLHRKGDTSLAQLILESVRQMASYKDSKGMWFDVESSKWNSPNPLLLTARCLEAFRLVEPESEVTDLLTQYLILSRQTIDWNLQLGQAGVASVVSRLLTSASSDYVTSGNAGLRILLNGKEIPEISTSDILTGNFYVNLSPTVASEGVLTIERESEGVAWGGIVSQYVQPISEVKAHGMPQLSVEKSLLSIEVGETGKKVSVGTNTFKKGDRVRVTLTLETDRELDYVLIKDAFGAWMQPADQLTKYALKDGIWLLQETRKDSTNFYITHLPKGKYVISYEVNAARDGEYSTGIASAQSQYYPLITSHSGGMTVEVK